MTALVNRSTGEIMEPNEPADLRLLDSFSAGPVTDEDPRLDALCTISAGTKAEGKDGHAGLPMVSRTGEIFIHDPKGRAPALKAALELRGNKALTIAFPFNNAAAFVQQRFTDYSSTHLLAYGDEYAITCIGKDGARKVLDAGTDEYDAARKRCKVSTSIYFALAEWTSQGPRMVWPDGLGLYRLRTTSRNSLRNLRAAITHVSSFTGGQVAGIPFDIALDYRDVAGPDGSRRNVPVWTFTMRPPETLTSRTFTPLLRAALAEGQLLQIAPPSSETEAVAEGDFRDLGDDEAISDSEAALVASGGRCDAEYFERIFFRSVRGTKYDSDFARGRLMLDYTDSLPGDHITDSLAEFLEHSSEQEASTFIAHLNHLLDAEPAAERQAKAEALAPAMAPPRRDAVERINAMRPDDGYVDGTPRRAAPHAQPMPDAVAADEASVPPAEPLPEDDDREPIDLADDYEEQPDPEPAPAVGADIPISSTHDPKWQAWLALVKLANDAGASESVPTLARPEQVPMLASELRAHYGALQAAVKAARQTTA